MSKEIILDNGIRITGAILLTTEEALALPVKTSAIEEPWWLCSQGYSNSAAAYVGSAGIAYSYGSSVNNTLAVRPALIIDMKSSELKIGDAFKFGKKYFEIISDTKALCMESIAHYYFNGDILAGDANDYESSDIKRFIDSWYHEQTNTFATPSSLVSESTEDKNAITLENRLVVKGATLLNTDEAEELPEETRAIGEPWWLHSPGSNSNLATTVGSDGSVDYYGFSVDNYDAVRPALILDLESSNFNIGDTFDFGDRKFEIISNTKALCMESVGKCTFRADWLAEGTNDYESSDIKRFIDNWYKNECELIRHSSDKKPQKSMLDIANMMTK